MKSANDFAFSGHSFRDVDSFIAWEVEMGWDLAGTQLSCGSNSIHFEHLGFADLIVMKFRAKRAMFNTFTIPSGFMLFFIPRMKQSLVWDGGRIEDSVIPIVRSDRTNDVVLPEELDAYEFLLTEDLIRRSGLLPPGFMDETANLKYPLLPLVPSKVAPFTRKLDHIFASLNQAGPLIHTAFDGAAIRDFLVQGLREVFDAGLLQKPEKPPRRTRRADLVAKAREYLAENLTDGVPSDLLAQAVGASDRVLRHAFRDSLGVSPYRYHLIERLHAARRMLLSDHASITDASMFHGFNNPSRFARQYRRLFGELPSETITRRI